MAEQPVIVTDPNSSDGSEESWILLDEMDEAMNEVDVAVDRSTTETDKISVAITPVISVESPPIEAAVEALQTSDVENIIDNDIEPKIDRNENSSTKLIETCPSDDCDNSDVEHVSR